MTFFSNNGIEPPEKFRNSNNFDDFNVSASDRMLLQFIYNRDYKTFSENSQKIYIKK